MSTNIETMFALTLNECADAIEATGSRVTTLIQGHMRSEEHTSELQSH